MKQTEYRDAALASLRSRAERLIKLIDLRAPGQVIGAEVGLVNRAALMLGDEAVLGMHAGEVRDAKQGMGYCGEPHCFDAAVEPARFELCRKHQEEIRGETEETTLDQIADRIIAELDSKS